MAGSPADAFFDRITILKKRWLQYRYEDNKQSIMSPISKTTTQCSVRLQ
jgi:hypothetical protein